MGVGGDRVDARYDLVVGDYGGRSGGRGETGGVGSGGGGGHGYEGVGERGNGG